MLNAVAQAAKTSQQDNYRMVDGVRVSVNPVDVNVNLTVNGNSVGRIAAQSDSSGAGRVTTKVDRGSS
ncbi:MAG TPA: hypothetical protein VHO70_14425 [Chitinispirillaceae bacterium]|nr:hypothetical protein [Chitinispirillaceae bacterium]